MLTLTKYQNTQSIISVDYNPNKYLINVSVKGRKKKTLVYIIIGSYLPLILETYRGTV
jgi:hypothetical protein